MIYMHVYISCIYKYMCVRWRGYRTCKLFMLYVFKAPRPSSLATSLATFPLKSPLKKGTRSAYLPLAKPQLNPLKSSSGVEGI